MNIFKRLYCVFWGHDYNCIFHIPKSFDGSVVIQQARIYCDRCDKIFMRSHNIQVWGTWDQEDVLEEARKIANGN